MYFLDYLKYQLGFIDTKSAFLTSIQDRDMPLYKDTLKHIDNVNFINAQLPQEKCTPLLAAISNGFASSEIEYLIKEKGADVNLSLKYGITPLFAAINRLDSQLVKLLLENGADVNQASFRNMKPIHIASYVKENAWKFFDSEQVKIIKLLMDYGANPNELIQWTELYDPVSVQDSVDGIDYLKFIVHTPLSIAAREGNLGAVKYLVDHGADVNATVGYGNQSQGIYIPAWLVSVLSNDYNVVKYLTDHGAKTGPEFLPEYLLNTVTDNTQISPEIRTLVSNTYKTYSNVNSYNNDDNYDEGVSDYDAVESAVAYEYSWFV
jgi:ankyrin repeat protein